MEFYVNVNLHIYISMYYNYRVNDVKKDYI